MVYEWQKLYPNLPDKGQYVWLRIKTGEGLLDEKHIVAYTLHINQFGISFLDPLNPSQRYFAATGDNSKIKYYAVIPHPDH